MTVTKRIRRVIGVMILILAVVGLPVQPQAAPRTATEQGVRFAFGVIKDAIFRRDGTAIARMIDDDTAAYFERVRVAALNMPKADLLKQPVYFQIAVVSTRQHFKSAEIEKIGGRELYGRHVEFGDAGPARAFDAVQLGNVVMQPDGISAIADLESDGKPVEEVRLRFFLKDNRWRIDLMRLMKPAIAELDTHVGVNARTPPAAVEEIMQRDLFPALAARSGRPVTKAVWLPLAGQN